MFDTDQRRLLRQEEMPQRPNIVPCSCPRGLAGCPEFLQIGLRCFGDLFSDGPCVAGEGVVYDQDLDLFSCDLHGLPPSETSSVKGKYMQLCSACHKGYGFITRNDGDKGPQEKDVLVMRALVLGKIVYILLYGKILHAYVYGGFSAYRQSQVVQCREGLWFHHS